MIIIIIIIIIIVSIAVGMWFELDSIRIRFGFELVFALESLGNWRQINGVSPHLHIENTLRLQFNSTRFGEEEEEEEEEREGFAYNLAAISIC